MNASLPIRTEDGATFRYGKNATIPEAPFSLSHLAHRGVQRSRLAALLAIGLLAVLCNGCAHRGRVTESSPREVFGFTFDDSAGSSYYEAGLAISKLFDRETFHIFLKDLPITQAMPSSPDAPKLPDACFASKDAIRIEPGSTPNTVTVRVDFRSPFAFPNEGVSKSKGMSQWITTCHCRSPEEELTGECFSERLVNSISDRLANNGTSTTTNRPVTKLTQEARQRITREAGMPFGAFDILAHRERGLIKPGELTYFGQLLNPGELLCFHSSSYSPSWGSNSINIASTAEPAEPACFPWETLLRSKYRKGGGEGLLSTGIDPLSRWANPWREEEEARISAVQRDGDRIVNSPDAITRPIEGPFRYALVFAKNEEFLIPHGPERDFKLSRSDQEPKPDEQIYAGGFILLVRDARLMNYLRENISDFQRSCNEKKFEVTAQRHKYLECLVMEWGSHVGIPIPDTKVANWMLDVIVPSNVRPFVGFEVMVGDQAIRVRAGATLLNLIDRRIGLSARIFDLRSENSVGATATETPTQAETALVTDAVERVLYERRAGLTTAPVKLCHAKRLEDLLIPLKPGDRVTWQD